MKLRVCVCFVTNSNTVRDQLSGYEIALDRELNHTFIIGRALFSNRPEGKRYAIHLCKEKKQTNGNYYNMLLTLLIQFLAALFAHSQ